MHAVGILCEYNPFHNGHAYHIQKARELSDADYVVCAMSGALTQRGTFARHDKWTRAHMALCGGADLVLELPARFACAPAQEFAAGGAALLSSLGVVTHLSFGCEGEALPGLEQAQRLLVSEPPAFRDALREGLDAGMSFPRARAHALDACCEDESVRAALSLPNAALALEYLAALPPQITPVPVLREGSGYHDTELDALPSATGVRHALSEGRLEQALQSVPAPQLLQSAEERGDTHEEDALDQALLFCLRSMDAQQLEAICGMDEGLQHRFLAAAQRCASRKKLIEAVKTKRYTWARLSRLCSLSMLDLTRELAQSCSAPTYARVLGFKKSAAPLMRAIKERSALPLVVKAADYADPLFALDVRAQDLWSLGCSEAGMRACGRDYVTGPVIL